MNDISICVFVNGVTKKCLEVTLKKSQRTLETLLHEYLPIFH